MPVKRIEELKAKLKALESQPIEEVGEELITTLSDLAKEIHRSNPAKTEEYARRALALAEELGDEKSVARCHQLIGISYIFRGDNKQGLEYSLIALKFYEHVESKAGIADCCNNIGYLHSTQGDTDRALEYLFRALKLNEESGLLKKIANNHNTIGAVYDEIGEYDKSLEHYLKALELSEEHGTVKNTINPLLNIGALFVRWNKYEQAMEYFQKVLTLAEESEDKRSLCICMHNMGEVQLDLKHYDSSLGYLEQSLEVALEIESRKMEILNYELLSKLFEEQDEHKKALEYYQKHSKLKSVVFNEESAERIAQLEVQHNVEKKEQQADIYRLKNVELEAVVQERTERLSHLNAILSAIRNVNQLITHEMDRDELLQQACEKLIETRGYYSAWILLLDKNNKVLKDYCAGFANGKSTASSAYKCSSLTQETCDVVTIEAGDKMCQHCPRATVEKNDVKLARLLTRLNYDGSSFGVICVTLPPKMAHDPDEHSLFEELSGDLSFALHHRQVDNQRKESERLYRSLYDSMSEGMTVNELIYKQGRAVDYRVVDVNPAFEMIAHKQWSELVDKHATEIYGGSTVPFIEIMEDIVERQKPTSFEMYYPRLKGHFHTSVFSLGGKTFATVLTDVTERTKAEKALKTSETRFRNLVEQSSVSMVIYDPSGKALMVNKAWEELWGLKFEELAEFNILRDEQIKKQGIMPYIERGFAGETVTTPPTLYRAEDSFQEGFARWVIGRIYPICDENNNIQNVVLMVEDITERKQAEEDREQIYKRLLEEQNMFVSGNVVIFKWKNEEGWPVEYVSENVEDVFGYSVKDWTFGALSYAEIIVKDDLERVGNAVKHHSESGASKFEHEPYRIISKNGKIIWLVDHTTILRDKAGNVTHYLGYVVDVTELKQAEEALRDSEAMMRAIFDAALDSIIAIGEDGMITHFNQAAEKMFGQKAEDIIGGPLYPLIPEEYIARHEVCVPSFFATGKPDAAMGMTNYEPARRSNGEIFPMEITLSDGEHSKGKFVVGIARDITQRKQAEEALQKSEERYRTLVETILEGVWTVDCDENIIFANPAFCDILGYSQDEITGMNLCDFISPEEFEEVLQQTSNRKKGLSSQYEVTVKRKDGEFRQVEISASPWLNEDGEYQGAVGLILDITERKQAEEALRHSEERYRLISDNTSDLISVLTFSLDPVYTYVSPSHSTLGYEPENLLGKSGLNYVHPKDKRKLIPLLKQYVTAKAKKLFGKEQENITEHLEYRVKDKDGNWHYLESTANIVGDSLLFISRNVSERRKELLELQESEDLFSNLVKAAPDGIEVLDTKGYITGCNDAHLKMLGYTSEEMVSRHTTDFLIPESIAVFMEKYPQIREAGGADAELTLICKDGTEVPVWRKARAIYDSNGDFAGVVAYNRDITEQKEAEEALSESERIYHLLYDTALAATQKTDLDETIRIIGDQVTELLNSEYCLFYQYNGDKKQLIPLYTNAPIRPELNMQVRLSLGEGLAGKVGAEKIGAISNYTDTHRPVLHIEGTDRSRESTQSIIAEPILDGEDLLGVLLLSKNNSVYQEKDQEYIRIFARMTELVLSRTLDADALSESERIYHLLYDTVLAVTRKSNLDEIVAIIGDQATKLLNSVFSIFYRYDSGKDHLYPIYTNKIDEKEEIMQLRLPLGSGLAGKVGAEKRGAISNYTDHNRPMVPIKGTNHTVDAVQSIIAEPIMDGEELLGVLLIGTDNDTYQEQDQDYMRIFAQMAALVLVRATNTTALKESEQVYRALYNTTLTLADENDQQKVIEVIAQNAISILGAGDCMVMLADYGAEVLRPYYTSREEYRELFKTYEMPFGSGLSGKVQQTGVGRYLNIGDEENLSVHIDGTDEDEDAEESIISVPMFDGERVLGVLTVTKLHDVYTDDDLRRLTILARQAEIALKRSQNIESLAASEETYRALYNTALATTEERSLDKTIEQVVDTIHNLFDAYWSCYFRYEKETETIATVYANTLDNGDKVRALHIPLGTGLSGLVAEQRQGMYSNYDDTERPIANIGDTSDSSNVESLLAEPVLDGDKLLGVLFVSVKHRLFTDDDLLNLRVFARLTAVNIKRTDSIESLAASEATYRTLYKTTTALAEVNDLGEVTRVMVEQAAELLNARHCTFYRLTPDGLIPIQTTASKLREEIMSFPLKLGEGLTGRTAVAGVGVISNYGDNESVELVTIPGTETDDDDFESLICEPIKSGGQVTGVLTLSTLHKSFTERDPEALRIFARLASIALNQAENRRELEDSETKHRALIETATDGIAIIQDNTFKFANPAMEQLSGYSAAEMLGLPFLSTIAPEEQERVTEIYQKRMIGEDVPTIYETIGVDKDGKRIPVEINVSVFSYEGSPAELVLIRDITERKEAEAEMRKLSLSVKNSPSVVAITDTDGLLEYVNPRFTEVTGYTSEEAIGQNPRILNASLQSDEYFEEMWATITTGKDWHGEFANRRKDGTVYWESVRMSAITNSAGKIINYVKLAEDITERKQNELELKKREVILEAVSRLGDQLLRSVNWEANANTILRELCQAADASRVYIFENSWLEDGVRHASQRFEWAVDGVSSEIDNPELQNLPYSEDSFQRWEQLLQNEELVHGTVRDFPQSERDILESQDIKSILIVPIFVCKDWWGFIGFDNCVSEEEWSASQVDALRVAASILGSSIGRQHMVEELRQSEERYRLVIDNSPLGIVVCDTTGKLELVNESLVKMLGSPSVAATMQINAFNFPLLQKAGISKAFRTTLETGLSFTTDHFYKSKWGKETFVRFFLTPLKDNSERIIGVQALVQDISETVEAEAKLRESEEQLQAVFEYAPIAYFLQDLKGNLLDGNRTAEELTGYSRKELTNKSFTQLKILSTKDIARAVGNMMKNALGKATGPVEYTLNRKDGSKVPVAISAYPIKIKGKTIVLGVAVDMTDRKKAESALENYSTDLEREVKLKTNELNQAQTFLRSVIDGLQELITVADAEGRLEIVNTTVTELTGYTESEVLGKPISLFYSDDDLDELYNIQQRLAIGEANVVAQVNIRRKNGSLLPVELSVSTLLDVEGHITGSIGIGRDIREVKQLRKALLQSEKLASTGQLAANIAHEVNNPLTIIKNYLHLATDNLNEGSQNNEILAIIGEEVERIARIINGLLSFYRPENTRLAPTDINRLIEKLLGFVNITLEKSNIIVEDELESDLPSITLAPDQLYQVLLNMVKNAQEAMPDGGKLFISTRLKKRKLHISVSDTGRGIEPDILSDIFDPFFTTKGETGTGLGLSISYGIIKGLDGDIKVTSKPGKGSTFTIILPTP